MSATQLSGALADGQEEVEIQVVVRDGAGAPLEGRVVRIHSSQPADQIAQPVALTDAQGVSLASMVTVVEGVRTLWAVVDPDGAAIELGSMPLVHFEPQPVQPNFLIILLDDIGTDSLALYDEVNPYKTDLPYDHSRKGLGAGDVPGNGSGSSNLYVLSQRLQQLADDGVLFLNAYAMPVCSSTRATLLTGNYPVRTGVGAVCSVGFIGGALNEFGDPGFEQPTLPQLVRGADYDDILVGKWHLGMPTGNMFPDETETPPAPPSWTSFHGWSSIPLRGGFENWVAVFTNLDRAPQPPPVDNPGMYAYYLSRSPETDHTIISATVETTFATTLQFDEALAWCNTRTKPFLCVLATSAAHSPWQDLPPSELTKTPEYTDVPLNAWSGQMAQIEAVDTKLGNLLDGLSSEVRAKTTIILIGDNGLPEVVLEHARHVGTIGTNSTGSGKDLGAVYDFLLDDPRQRFKASCYEKGIRVPMIVSGYGVANPGRISKALVDVSDIFPTVAEMSSQPVPSQMHGVSFLPILANQADHTTHARDYTYSEFFAPMGLAGAGGSLNEWRIGCSLHIPGAGRYKIVYDYSLDATGEPVETEEFYQLQDASHDYVDPVETNPLDHGPADAEYPNYLLVRARLDEIVASGAQSGPQACTTSQSFCTSIPNSTGSAALISDQGPCSIALNRYTLRAGPLPDEFGLFFYSTTPLNGGLGGAFGGGWLCLANPTYRLPIVQVQGNELEFAIDLQDLPSEPFLPDQTWHFQAWFRDTVAGGTQGNYSDGLTVTFGY